TRPAVLRGVNVVESIMVARPPRECFSFWRDPTRFPSFIDDVVSVALTGERTSHWVVRAPLGQEIEWDAEIVKVEKDRLIEWKTLEGAEVVHAGAVRFEPGSSGQHCKVTVYIRW